MSRQAEKRGILRYDKECDRYWIQCEYETISLSCGEVVGLRIGQRYVWGRLEVDLAGSWCIIFPGSTDGKSTVLTLRTAGTYDAKIYL